MNVRAWMALAGTLGDGRGDGGGPRVVKAEALQAGPRFVVFGGRWVKLRGWMGWPARWGRQGVGAQLDVGRYVLVDEPVMATTCRRWYPIDLTSHGWIIPVATRPPLSRLVPKYL